MVSKMIGDSLDITKQNIERLIELFPEVLTDGEKIDFDLLKTVLGEVVEDNNERYQFTWHGKKQAILCAQKPSKGTLRPVPEKSKNFDTTENLYIEGDNLEVLKLLQKSFNGKVKMIYIDPPYNTGKDFVYKDNFKGGVQNYLEQTGQVDSEGNHLSTNTESNGRFHTDWINMMYSRLKLARNLLTDDGALFISIDDNEIVNLTKLCDEIFGETNKIGPIIQNKKNSKNDTINIQKNHEYILVYRKRKLENKKGKEIPTLFQVDKDIKRVYKESNEYYYLNDPITTRGEGGTLNARPNLGYTVYYHPEILDKFAVADYNLELARTSNNENEVYTTNEELVNKGYIPIRPPKVRGKLGAFTWDLSKFNNNLKDIVITGNPESYSVRKRTFVSSSEVYTENGKEYVSFNTIKNIRSIIEFSTNDGTTELNNVLDSAGLFDNPKNLEMIKYFISIVNDSESIVLDFFSGSATTAHAVMQLNAEDGGNRKFIMVQLPELLEEKTEAYKNGYRTICDIGEERIRRAGEKIKQELVEKRNTDGILDENTVDPESLDIGFKVFKLDRSNIREWNTDFENIEEQMEYHENPFIDNRTELDIVYEIMLKHGLELTYPISTFEVDGKKVYDIAFGNLFICLAENINIYIAKTIIAKRDEYGIETSSVVFSDAGFGGNDSEKLNCIELLKDAGYPEDNIYTI
ncbi:site-specific DNA-methyltransferase [Gottfriedia acidiceleris]|uniref:site-specific DNA-methyltransferase n=1 Tax=Gottfriedia acidiceleris TaxID=371036 RepID=UPI003000100A